MIFASHTSLVTYKILEKELDKIGASGVIQRVGDNMNKIHKKMALSMSSGKHDSPFKRILVQSLDFDWIFEEDNVEKFIHLLHH